MKAKEGRLIPPALGSNSDPDPESLGNLLDLRESFMTEFF
jgi:hypothetical protein